MTREKKSGMDTIRIKKERTEQIWHKRNFETGDKDPERLQIKWYSWYSSLDKANPLEIRHEFNRLNNLS